MHIKTGKYIDFKGDEFEVVEFATQVETLVEMVICRALCDNKLWVKPATLWNEFVEHNGQLVKRFTHEYEIVVKQPILGVHKQSTPREKIDLFLSMFRGREDVIAGRFENSKTGKSGYAPICLNKWNPLCPKSAKNKFKCSECKNKNFMKYNAKALDKHLRGIFIIGVYPMLQNETCNFLVFDFDGKECSWEEISRDVSAIRDVCAEKNISMLVERSRSGMGIHFWIFFSEPISVVTARKFGSSLITYTMCKHHEVSFKTYDRMIPSQDTMPKGGFGNLIALPLQGEARKKGNSVFVDNDFNVYKDQWNHLSGIKKYSLSEIEQFINDLAPTGELGVLHEDREDEKPWEIKKPTPKLTESDFPESVDIVRSNMLYIKKKGISNQALNILKRLAAFKNPEFYKAQALRLSTRKIPRIISCFEETEQYVCLPRGLEEAVNQIIPQLITINKVNEGKIINLEFKGTLRVEQRKAVDSLIKHENGVLSATTAFGKTVVGAYMIAERKVNTLILVHRTNLLAQWIKRLNEFLIINEEPVPEFTLKGRIKKKDVIGQIGAGKDNISGIVDVAIMQSLVSRGEVKELVRNYGMVIVDECHHVSAFSFERILKTTNAKYVYGLTATPTRQDGHHHIIYMQCGKIRYKDDAKSQAESRPFEHYIIPRFTRFQKHINQDDKWGIVDIYKDILNDEIRNNMIVKDVIAALENGRSPIILTERKEHVRILSELLITHTKKVIQMVGGLGNKQSRELLQKVSEIPNNESFVLVATGKFVGEGFDLPRLDTLFLTMPVSWKGTVQQYAGRLHRFYEGKNEVQIYDYVDIHIPMLERMYQKRLKGYASIGYKAKGSPQAIEKINSIFDSKNYFHHYSNDVLSAQKEVIIVSPHISKRSITSALSYLTDVSNKVTIVTKHPDNYLENTRTKIMDCIELLQQNGITVKTKEGLHQKYAVIDQRIIWYGSINLLSHWVSEESILRIESVDIAKELLGAL